MYVLLVRAEVLPLNYMLHGAKKVDGAGLEPTTTRLESDNQTSSAHLSKWRNSMFTRSTN